MEVAWARANVEVTFLPISGATFEDLVQQLAARRMGDFDAVVISCFGNEHFNAAHQVVPLGAGCCQNAIFKLLECMPKSKPHLIIYGGEGKMWLDSQADVDMFDRLVGHVRLSLAKLGYNVGSGVEELSNVEKWPGFHYPHAAADALVDIWMNWVQEAVAHQDFNPHATADALVDIWMNWIKEAAAHQDFIHEV